MTTLGQDAERGYTVMVVPWSDSHDPMPMAADRILNATQIEALTNGF
jgi:hypothetical protein